MEIMNKKHEPDMEKKNKKKKKNKNDGNNFYSLYKDICGEEYDKVISYILGNEKDNKPAKLIINSLGGALCDGFGIIHYMENSKIDIATECVGFCASCATLIAVAGTKGLRTISRNADYLVHTFTSLSWGTSHDLAIKSNQDKVIFNRMIEHYMKHTNLSKKQVKDICLGYTDRYLTPKECLKYGFVDAII